jgi:hypothetical protein
MSERTNLDGKKKAEIVKQIHEKAKRNIEERTKSYAKQANKGRRKVTFEEGDLVWVHLRKDRFPVERKSKLMPRVDGPFRVLKKINDNAYQLDLEGKYNVSSSFNITDLLPFVADDPDLRTNPFEEGGDDVIMEEMRPTLEDRGEITVPRGPMTRSMARKLGHTITTLLDRIGPTIIPSGDMEPKNFLVARMD